MDGYVCRYISARVSGFFFLRRPPGALAFSLVCSLFVSSSDRPQVLSANSRRDKREAHATQGGREGGTIERAPSTPERLGTERESEWERKWESRQRDWSEETEREREEVSHARRKEVKMEEGGEEARRMREEEKEKNLWTAGVSLPLSNQQQKQEQSPPRGSSLPS